MGWWQDAGDRKRELRERRARKRKLFRDRARREQRELEGAQIRERIDSEMAKMVERFLSGAGSGREGGLATTENAVSAIFGRGESTCPLQRREIRAPGYYLIELESEDSRFPKIGRPV